MGDNHSFQNKRHIFYTERFEIHSERLQAIQNDLKIIQNVLYQNCIPLPYNKNRFYTVVSDLFSLAERGFLPLCQFLRDKKQWI